MPEEYTFSTGELVAIALFLFNLIITGPIGWILRQHIADHKKLKDDVQEKLEEVEKEHSILLAQLPDKYVSLGRYLDEMKVIRDMLQRILDKLDTKADK